MPDSIASMLIKLSQSGSSKGLIGLEIPLMNENIAKAIGKVHRKLKRLTATLVSPLIDYRVLNALKDL